MKYPSRNAHAYRETSIKTASPLKLVVILYDEAIYQIETAMKIFESDRKQYDVINNAIGKTQDIITELMVSLDMEQGELAQNLFRLYMYINRVLSDANINKEPGDDLSMAREILQELRESWVSIAEHPPDTGPTKTSSGIDIAG